MLKSVFEIGQPLYHTASESRCRIGIRLWWGLLCQRAAIPAAALPFHDQRWLRQRRQVVVRSEMNMQHINKMIWVGIKP